MEEHQEIAPELGQGDSVITRAVTDATEAPDTLLESLRAKREELAESRDCFIPLPGYDQNPPIMMAKYRLLEGKEVEAIARKVSSETKAGFRRQTMAIVDTLIAACEGMYYDLQDDNGPQQMTFGGAPIMGYDTSLARALQFEAETARAVVFGVFGNNDVAIMQHGARLSIWMSDTSRDVSENFLGEL